MLQLSIVGTLYKSGSQVSMFVERVARVSRTLVGNDYEIILVVDGCEESLSAARELLQSQPNLVVIDLSRNFGHHKAMMTGLEAASGKYVFLIDTDLEEEPEWLVPFWLELHGRNVDVIFGSQALRRGNLFQRASGNVFYSIFSGLTGISSHNHVTARLMTRRFIDSLLAHRETELVIGGLWHLTGYTQVSVPVQKNSSSGTTYTLMRRISLAIASVVSFSNVPLILVFYLSIAIVLGAIGFLGYLLLLYLVEGVAVEGYLSVIASLWFLSGLTLFSLGLQNLYLAVIFDESKRRPRSIIRDVLRSSSSTTET